MRVESGALAGVRGKTYHIGFLLHHNRRHLCISTCSLPKVKYESEWLAIKTPEARSLLGVIVSRLNHKVTCRTFAPGLGLAWLGCCMYRLVLRNTGLTPPFLFSQNMFNMFENNPDDVRGHADAPLALLVRLFL